jgi:hypothetical protein
MLSRRSNRRSEVLRPFLLHIDGRTSTAIWRPALEVHYGQLWVVDEDDREILQPRRASIENVGRLDFWLHGLPVDDLITNHHKVLEQDLGGST